MTAEEKQIQDDGFRWACALGRLCGGHASRFEVVWRDEREAAAVLFKRNSKDKGNLVRRALASSGSVMAAARRLGVSRTTIYQWAKQ